MRSNTVEDRYFHEDLHTLGSGEQQQEQLLQ